jgi:phage portal protein BeeE
VLSTDLVLDKDQVQALRDRWDEQSRGLNQGKTPILTAGLKVQPWATAPRDAQLAEILKITEEHIALVFRVPMQILGIGGQHSFRTTEALMQFWVATGLGFALNHIEEAFGLLFQLKGQPEDYVEFDTSALLRSQIKDRLEALARGVQGGIYSPNEARKEEGLPEVPFGKEPRVQAQVVPLSAADKIPTVPAAHTPGSAPAAPGTQPKPATNDNQVNADDVKREIRNLHAAATRAGRRYSA